MTESAIRIGTASPCQPLPLTSFPPPNPVEHSACAGEDARWMVSETLTGERAGVGRVGAQHGTPSSGTAKGRLNRPLAKSCR
jgi:hypothetical protein